MSYYAKIECASSMGLYTYKRSRLIQVQWAGHCIHSLGFGRQSSVRWSLPVVNICPGMSMGGRGRVRGPYVAMWSLNTVGYIWSPHYFYQVNYNLPEVLCLWSADAVSESIWSRNKYLICKGEHLLRVLGVLTGSCYGIEKCASCVRACLSYTSVYKLWIIRLSPQTIIMHQLATQLYHVCCCTLTCTVAKQLLFCMHGPLKWSQCALGMGACSYLPLTPGRVQWWGVLRSKSWRRFISIG